MDGANEYIVGYPDGIGSVNSKRRTTAQLVVRVVIECVMVSYHATAGAYRATGSGLPWGIEEGFISDDRGDDEKKAEEILCFHWLAVATVHAWKRYFFIRDWAI